MKNKGGYLMNNYKIVQYSYNIWDLYKNDIRSYSCETLQEVKDSLKFISRNEVKKLVKVFDKKRKEIDNFWVGK